MWNSIFPTHGFAPFLENPVYKNQSRFELRPKKAVFGNLNWILKEIIFKFGSSLEKVGIRGKVTHCNIKSFDLQKGQNYVHFVIESNDIITNF